MKTIREKISNSKLYQKATTSPVKIIPVVVHVIHDGGTNNISDAQIQSQIDVLNEDFRKITGTNGDGNLDALGNADNSDWESVSGKTSGVKGGGWNSGIQIPYNDCAVSDRFYIYQNQNNKRNTVGGRGILSANF